MVDMLLPFSPHYMLPYQQYDLLKAFLILALSTYTLKSKFDVKEKFHPAVFEI